MKRIIISVIAAFFIVALVSCGAVDMNEYVLGNWNFDIDKSTADPYGIESLVIYRGGTGSAFDIENKVRPITWELSENTLVVILGEGETIRFKKSGDGLLSTDKEYYFEKETPEEMIDPEEIQE